MHILVLGIDDAIAAPLRDKLPGVKNITFELLESEREILDPVKNFSRPHETVLLTLGDPVKLEKASEIFDRFPSVAVIDPYDHQRASRLLGAGIQEVLAAKGCSVNQLFRALKHAYLRQMRLKMALRVVTRREVSSMLNRLPMAVIILSGDRQVLANNAQAQRLLHNGGVFARDDNGVLLINNRKLAADIKAQLSLIGEGEDASSPDFCAAQITDSDPPLYVLGVPAGRRSDRQALTLFIYTADANIRISTGLLQKLYGLTKAEAELAARLAMGLTLEDVAEENARSVQTLRSQLKQIFSKMAVSRQAELIKAILTGPAALASEKQPANDDTDDVGLETNPEAGAFNRAAVD